MRGIDVRFVLPFAVAVLCSTMVTTAQEPQTGGGAEAAAAAEAGEAEAAVKKARKADAAKAADVAARKAAEQKRRHDVDLLLRQDPERAGDLAKRHRELVEALLESAEATESEKATVHSLLERAHAKLHEEGHDPQMRARLEQHLRAAMRRAGDPAEAEREALDHLHRAKAERADYDALIRLAEEHARQAGDHEAHAKALADLERAAKAHADKGAEHAKRFNAFQQSLAEREDHHAKAHAQAVQELEHAKAMRDHATAHMRELLEHQQRAESSPGKGTGDSDPLARRAAAKARLEVEAARERIHAYRADEAARADAERAERDARAAHGAQSGQNSNPFRAGQFGRRQKAPAQNEEDIEAMLDELRQEMAEIRALMQEIRTRSGKAGFGFSNFGQSVFVDTNDDGLPDARVRTGAQGGGQRSHAGYGAGSAGVGGQGNGFGPSHNHGSTGGAAGHGHAKDDATAPGSGQNTFVDVIPGVGGRAGAQGSGQRNRFGAANGAAVAGERIVEVNGIPVETKAEVIDVVRKHHEAGAQNHHVKVERNGEVVNRTYETPR